MSLHLNKIADDRILENYPHVVRRTEAVEMRLRRASEEDIKELVDCHERLAHNCYELGCILHQQERPGDEILAHLHKAAEHKSKEYELLKPPTKDELREFPFFERLLNLLICFGTSEMRRRAATIPREIYHFTPEASYAQGVIEYLELLKKVAAASMWDEGDYLRAKQLCLSDRATRLERVGTVPKLEALRSAVHDDVETWNQNIAQIVKLHKHEAIRGYWKYDHEAFLCLPGLAMAQLGIERGLVCTVESPYLPLRLLGGNA